MDLTDAQWSVVSSLLPELPKRSDGRGRPWRCSRAVFDGILWILRTGAPWHDLPDRYPPYQTCHRRFQRWVSDGSLAQILHALAEDLYERGGLDLSECFIDGTFVAAKRGAPGRQDQAGQRYEAHGSGRPRWSSYRHTHPKRFASRGHARRSHPPRPTGQPTASKAHRRSRL